MNRGLAASAIVREDAPEARFTCFPVGVAAQTARAAHTHSAHEFFLCTNDHGTQFADRRAIPQKTGNLFCFPAGMPHYCSGAPRAGGYVFIIPDALFPPEIYGDRDVAGVLRRVVELANRGCNPLPLSAAGSNALRGLARAMAEEFKAAAPGYRAAAKHLAMDIFLHLLREPAIGAAGPAGAPRSSEERMAHVLRFIDAHFMELVTVRQAAQMAGMGRSRFHEEFRRTTGCTLVQYLTRVRIRAARRLLSDTDARVLDIALDCGFPSLSRFYEAFHDVTGSTPSRLHGARMR